MSAFLSFRFLVFLSSFPSVIRRHGRVPKLAFVLASTSYCRRPTSTFMQLCTWIGLQR